VNPDASPHRRYLAAIVPVAVFAVAIVALHRLGGEFHLRDILAEFAAIETWQVAAAVLLAAGSYLALTGYERLALDYVGKSMPWRQYGLTSFVAYAVGHNVGAAALSGGAVRYRMYSPLGLGAAEIARIVAFCTLTFALGVATLAGVSLITDAGEASSLLHAPVALSLTLGFAMLAGVVGYVLASAFMRAPVSWRGWRLQLPAPRLAIRQVAIASLDLALASSTLYVLLPASADVNFLTFEGLYMVALAAGVLSAVPGGLGVFESVLVLLLPDVPTPQLLGALLGYRLVYYALPFVFALLLLSYHELHRQRERLNEVLSWTRKSLDFVVPQAMALLVFGAGFLLLLSGATPGTASRLAALDRFLPLSVLELSHLAGSAVGVLLLILARGLLLRLDGAWHVTMWLLGAGIAASLLKGLDYEEALLLTAAMLPLWWTRRQFYRKASLLAEPLSPAWLASAAVAIGASVWIGLLAYRHVPYADELWWQFALDAHAPRMLRASLLAVLVLGTFAVLRLMTPARTASPRPTAADLERALPIIRSSPDTSANLALLGDKSLLFSDSGRAFLMYGVSHRSWVALGDPLGAAEEREDLVWHFRELADQAGAWSVFYQVSPEQLPIYVDAGLALSKLGEEARVPLDSFSLEGSARAALRQAHRRAQRDGLGFRIASADEAVTLMPELRRISDEWLESKSAAEKGFSLGRFSETYLRWFPMALVEHSGRIVAFSNVWESDAREELSVDLMRHSDAAPKSVMDFLFVELMLWGRAHGYRWFNLGMAPLAGLEEHRLAPAWHKIGRLVYRYGEDFYNFEGLRQYKEKFLPQWRPRYLAAPGGMALPRVLLDVTTLISGGVVETVHRDEEPERATAFPGTRSNP
jgi:phosphatidylglycerol lysyltransferase